jgi:hypothetical protein
MAARKIRHLLTAAATAAALALAIAPARGAAPARIVAVGDVHGAFDAFAGILRSASLIDDQHRWIGGKTILVQTGDVTDRGAGVKPVMDLLMALEPQASKAGGRVEVLLGNHEVMNLVGHIRDTTPEIHESFGGLAAYRDAFRPGGRYGRWLRSKNPAAVIEGTLFMHAGVSPGQEARSIKDLNRRVRADLEAWEDGLKAMVGAKLVTADATMQEAVAAAQAEIVKLEEKRVAKTLTDDDVRLARALIPVAQITTSSLFAGEGPMWFRGYATWSEEEGAAKTAALLKKYDLKRIVVGHTPLASGRIQPRFGHTLFLIDTGMLGPPTYKAGRASALEIDGDTVTAIYADERVPLSMRAGGNVRVLACSRGTAALPVRCRGRGPGKRPALVP